MSKLLIMKIQTILDVTCHQSSNIPEESWLPYSYNFPHVPLVSFHIITLRSYPQLAKSPPYIG